MGGFAENGVACQCLAKRTGGKARGLYQSLPIAQFGLKRARLEGFAGAIENPSERPFAAFLRNWTVESGPAPLTPFLFTLLSYS
jgi:hypothetical protein